MYIRLLMLVIAFVLVMTPAYATPLEEVKKTVDEVVRLVADKQLKKNEAKRRQALKQTIGAMFDYTEMARRSLGKHWNSRTEAERKQFVELFSMLLENSYAGKIESYNNEKIIYLKEMIDGAHAEVRSKVVTPKRDEYTLDYRLQQQKGQWMVYDVVIEGVSLVSNYRTQFNKIITTNGYPELVKKLADKGDELKKP